MSVYLQTLASKQPRTRACQAKFLKNRRAWGCPQWQWQGASSPFFEFIKSISHQFLKAKYILHDVTSQYYEAKVLLKEKLVHEGGDIIRGYLTLLDVEKRNKVSRRYEHF